MLSGSMNGVGTKGRAVAPGSPPAAAPPDGKAGAVWNSLLIDLGICLVTFGRMGGGGSSAAIPRIRSTRCDGWAPTDSQYLGREGSGARGEGPSVGHVVGGLIKRRGRWRVLGWRDAIRCRSERVDGGGGERARAKAAAAAAAGACQRRAGRRRRLSSLRVVART